MSACSSLLNSFSSLCLSNPPPPQITLPQISSSPPSTTTTISHTVKTQPSLIPLPTKERPLPSDLLAVLCPSMAHSNTLFFKSAYNLQVIVGENEPEEKLIGRFRRDVLRAGIIQECKRRRFFETNQEKRKRKTREAAKRNRKRRPQVKALQQDQLEFSYKEDKKDEDDNWDLIDVDLPYC